MSSRLTDAFKIPRIEINLPNRLAIAINLGFAERGRFTVYLNEGDATRLDAPNLTLHTRDLEGEGRGVIEKWLQSLGVKHVTQLFIAGRAEDRLFHTLNKVVSEWDNSIDAFITIVPPKGEPPLRVFEALKGIHPGLTKSRSIILLDYELLWNELMFIDKGIIKQPAEVLGDLIESLFPILGTERIRKISSLKSKIISPSIMYNVHASMFTGLQGALNIAEENSLLKYDREDVNYVILYLDGTGFEEEPATTEHEFRLWLTKFSNLVDADVIYGDSKDRELMVLLMATTRLSDNWYGHLSSSCRMVEKIVSDPKPALSTLEILGLRRHEA